MRAIAPFMFPCVLVGCISHTSRESQGPDFTSACAGKSAKIEEICGSAGIQSCSCEAAARKGMDYSCACKKP